jgi:hypothetical protein
LESDGIQVDELGPSRSRFFGEASDLFFGLHGHERTDALARW